MEIIRQFLIKLNDRIPSGENQKHNITLNDNEAICVTLMLGNVYMPFYLDDWDFEKIENNMNEVIDELYESAEEYIY